MVNEIDPDGRRRGLYGGIVQVASPIGLLFANGVFAVVTWLVAPDAFLAWAWRVPFLLSIVLVGIGYYIRRGIAESPLFEQIEQAHQESRAPFVEVMRSHFGQVCLAVGSRIGSDIVFYTFTLFLLIYLPKIGLPGSLGFSAILCAAVAQILAIPLFGALSDRFGRRPILLFGAVSSIVWAFIFVALVETKAPPLILLASFVGMFLHGAMWGPLGSYLPEMFETRVRCTGASIGFQLAGVFGGAPAPIIATSLVAAFGSAWPVAIYLAAALVLMIVCVSLTRETAHSDLRMTEPAGTHAPAAAATRA
jgi:MFS family permease